MMEAHNDIERRLDVLEARPDGGQYHVLEERVSNIQKAVEGLSNKIWGLIGLVGTIIFLGLVIGVLVASFAFGGGKRV